MTARTDGVVAPVRPAAAAGSAGPAAARGPSIAWRYWPILAIVAMAGLLTWFALWSQGASLGNSRFSHPPLYGMYGPVFTDWTLIRLVPAGLLLAAAAWAVTSSRRTPAGPALVLIVASAWVTSLAVNLIRGDQQSLVRGVSTTQGTYYTRDLHLIDELGVRGFVTGFPSLVDHLIAWNGRTHPPGVQVFLWSVSKLVHAQPFAFTMVLALLSLCTAIGAWAMARSYAGERAGRIAAVLAVAAPGPLMLAYTNMDAVFATFFAAAAAFFVVGTRRRSMALAGAGGAVLGFATFLTYATAFLALATAIAVVAETRSLRQSAKLLGSAAVGGAAVLVVLWATLGFNLFASYQALTRSGAAFYRYWVVGQPAAWLIWAGLPLAALGMAGLFVKVPGARRPILPAVLIIIMIIWGTLPSSITALRQGEVERTWAFLYPMLAASAGPVIAWWTQTRDRPRRIQAGKAPPEETPPGAAQAGFAHPGGAHPGVAQAGVAQASVAQAGDAEAGSSGTARFWAGSVVALLVALSVAQAGVIQSLWDNLT